MPGQKLALLGWKSKKTGYYPFYRCPGCGHCQDMIFWGEDRAAECFTCHSKFPESSFGRPKLRRIIAVCAGCDTDVPLVPSTCGGIGYICSDCDGYVAVHYGRGTVDPRTALRPTWNPTVCKRADLVEKGRVLLRCRTQKDLLVVQLLQVLVKQEDSRFMFMREKEHEAGLYFDKARKKYLGFIVWNVSSGHAVLRQLFIIPDERGKGHAEQLVSFWVRQYADRISDTFGIEAPNDKALSLLTKLGYIKADGKSKCFQVPSF